MRAEGFPSVILCHTCQPQLGVCFLHVLSKLCLSMYSGSTFIHPPVFHWRYILLNLTYLLQVKFSFLMVPEAAAFPEQIK